MTDRPTDDTNDLAWLEARERGVAGVQIDASRAAAYARIEADLAKLPGLRAPDGWRNNVRRLIDSKRTPRNYGRWLLAAAFVIAVTAIAILLIVPPELKPPKSALADTISVNVIRSGEVVRGGDTAAIGDTLILEAPAHGELRLYHDDRDVVLRCPGASTCDTTSTGLLKARYLLGSSGTFRAVLIRGPRVAEPTGGLARDLGMSTDFVVATPIAVQH